MFDCSSGHFSFFFSLCSHRSLEFKFCHCFLALVRVLFYLVFHLECSPALFLCRVLYSPSFMSLFEFFSLGSFFLFVSFLYISVFCFTSGFPISAYVIILGVDEDCWMHFLDELLMFDS